MPNDPILGQTEFEQNQAQGWVVGNERFVITNAIAALVITARQDSPPGSPTDGDTYIVGDTPAGGWSTFATDSLAVALGGAWINVAARGGMKGERLDEGGQPCMYSETETAWVFDYGFWSTTEQRIAGQFPGALDRFAKAFEDVGLPNIGSVSIAHGITSLDVDEYMVVEGVLYDGTSALPLPWTDGTDRVDVSVDGTNIVIATTFDATTWNVRLRLVFSK